MIGQDGSTIAESALPDCRQGGPVQLNRSKFLFTVARALIIVGPVAQLHPVVAVSSSIEHRGADMQTALGEAGKSVPPPDRNPRGTTEW